VALLRYIGRYPNNHTAFVCLKTVNLNLNDTNQPNFTINKKINTNNYNNNNNNEINNNNTKTTQNLFNNVNSFRDISFVLPLELEVTQQAGIYSPVEMIDFQSVSIRKNYFNDNDSIFPATMALNDFENTLISPFINETINENLKKVFNLYLTNNAATALEIKVLEKYFFIKFIF
jgi:hypothetical protein